MISPLVFRVWQQEFRLGAWRDGLIVGTDRSAELHRWVYALLQRALGLASFQRIDVRSC